MSAAQPPEGASGAPASSDALLAPLHGNPFSLEGKRIFISGASSGIGRRMAVVCAAMGAELFITGRDMPRLSDTLTALQGSGHRAEPADLTVPEQREQLVDAMGPVDGVVHNAGISRLAPVRQASPKHLQEVWQTNYEAPVMLTQRMLARQLVRADGSIVFMSSIAAYVGVAGVAAYSGTKAALIATMRCLAAEVVKRRIRVNCLAPALVESPLLEATAGVVGSLDKEKAAYPLGFGRPDDVANAAVYLLSPASRWVTGTTLVLDGGLTLS